MTLEKNMLSSPAVLGASAEASRWYWPNGGFT